LADISDLQQSEVVRITNESETQVVGVTSEGEITSIDGIRNQGVNGSLTVGTSAVEVKVGAQNLANRKVVSIHNFSNRTIFWGYSNSVTVANGTPILRDDFVALGVSDNVSIWLISDTAGLDIRITEAY